MHRPLREPLYLRIWHLIRGVFLYNTVYWRRASDGLNLPTLSPEERERQRPARNLEIIKPRARPRAHIEAVTDEPPAPPVNPLAGAQVYDPLEEIAAASDVREERRATPAQAAPRALSTETDDGTEQVYVKRRRYRRKLSGRGSMKDRSSFFARVFGKK